MPKTILVLGGTGKLGTPVARYLLRDEFNVRILTRNKANAQTQFDESFELFQGDPLDETTLEQALKGCYGVHMSICPPKIEPAVVEKVIAISKRIGIQRLSYVSGTNNSRENTWHFIPRVKLAAEKIVKESGIPFTIFCPTATMENIPEHVRNNRAGVFGKQPHPLHLFAADDFGKMVADSYRLKEAENKRLFIHGPEAIRLHDAVKRYCSVFHPEIKKVSTMPFWLARIIAFLSKDENMQVAVLATSLYNKAGEGGDPAEANRILGAPTTTLDQWLKLRKEKYSAVER